MPVTSPTGALLLALLLPAASALASPAQTAPEQGAPAAASGNSALYAGYSQGGFSDDRIREIFNNTRSLFLKVTYAWQPGA
jgi:opacity protein-like surface antigen